MLPKLGSFAVEYLNRFFTATSPIKLPPCNLTKRIRCKCTISLSPGVKGLLNFTLADPFNIQFVFESVTYWFKLDAKVRKLKHLQ